ncbi:hypothetical protein CU098_004939 [Rhizopus stolonifer]|uniref:Uncharacterized protein n=1 Tax=Rhizopus stolonifer TaxID=4846 RepID=A0A367IQH5_RHIST|nr:hypothetical protein CU098_004939 [Rhizopus stolonifer]
MIDLSALLAAGACQLASAVVPDRQFTVSVVPSLNSLYMACKDHSTRRNTQFCSDQTQYSSTIAIPKEDNETKLAYLMTDDSLSPFGSAYTGIELGTNNDYYYCSPCQITTTTVATVTTTATAPPTCANKSVIYDKKNNGYKDDCCKTEAECRDDCVKGKCT